MKGKGGDPPNGGDVLILFSNGLAQPIDFDFARLRGEFRW